MNHRTQNDGIEPSQPFKQRRKPPSFVTRTRNYIEPLVQILAPQWQATDYSAKVVSIEHLAFECTQITLKPQRAWSGFRAGQHVRLRMTINGSRQTRTFSISSSPDSFKRTGLIELTVQKQPDGQVTPWIAANLSKKNTVHISEAQGRFCVSQKDRDLRRKMIFVAGGVGITPVISNIEQLLAESKCHPITLIYSYRERKGADSFLFRDRINQLVQNHPNLNVHLINTSQAGRLDITTLDQITNISQNKSAKLYACGPGQMVQSITRDAIQLGMDSQSIISEYFGIPAASSVDKEAAQTRNIRFVHEQKTTQFIPTEHNSMLIAAEQAGLKPSYGCRAGVCHECVCEKLEGQTQNVLTGELSGFDRELIQLCVSRPVSDITINKLNPKL